MADDFEKLPNGRYQTKGLTSKTFDKLFNLIGKQQRDTRRKGKKTLTKGLLRNKSLEDILKLGKKKDGMFFTIDDLKGFEANRDKLKAKFDPKTAGITYHQLIAHCLKIDVDRANNKVNDGSGISSAAFTGMKHNVMLVNVTASQASVHQHHRVRIRLEEWDDAMDQLNGEKGNPKKVVKNLCAGRVSVDCDCGRWQYWYRYIGTAGNFALTPPKEYAYPKVRNPRLQGVACKHIIHALTRLQAGSWQITVAKALERDSNRVGFGDDKRKTTKFFGEKDLRALARNRKSQTDQKSARQAWMKYKRHQRALEKRLNEHPDELEALRKQLNRKKKISANQQQKIKVQQQRIKQLEENDLLLKQQLRDAMALKQQTFIDAQVFTGKTPEQAQKLWLAFLNSQVKGGKK
ncbi:phage tail protein [Citrobacter portucalensis]|uniref:phage tail protein n=1 Tax=Citrobacter portucalensis TaxID=1639133 RepID=UPI00226B508B|nr:phage tail protein [Citrobacter portucalensis]MCX8980177.1 phage tail protein [Citrobacter portucalensis]